MVRKLNKMYDASPLYAQIADDLRDKIQSEVWQTGDKIPPELDLCELYNVSRITVRKAIDELVRENLLYRERAKGTFVRDWEEAEDEHFTLVRSFTNEMKELGKKAATLHAEVEVINADKKIALQLGLSVGDKVLQIKRLRGTKDLAFALFISFIPYNQDYSLKAEDYYGSFYEYLKGFGIVVNQEKEYIEAMLPNREVQEALAIDKQEPILKRVRMTKQIESDFREYSECFYVGKHYRYYIDFE
ncbi:GntR family transcriptional regulator [Listeria monocytogenes]|uniref:GntR family transcriptional regulator n=1 Tax=Listeria monocytogenes TaxID=1639 RepID=UPI000875843E|nr:GntR family transcriptional regulator [Listeria monocytogenes]OFG65835.1 GntR family transcriptional regulator [Listeria monocytogenes]